MPEKIKKRHLLDYGILIPYLILCVFGLVMVYSSTSYYLMEVGANSMTYVRNQTIFWVLSLILIAVVYKMRTQVFRSENFANIIMIVIIALLVYVRFFGHEVNGAKGWIKISSFTLQPAEFFKLISIWYLALKLSKRQNKIQGSENFWHTVTLPLLIIGVGLFFIMWMPDYGNAAVCALCLITVLVASGINWVWSIATAAGGVGLSYGFIRLINATGGTFLPAHVASRFLVFQDPFKDEFDKGHQLVNGYYAMFNGGWFGKGLGNSVQKKGFLKFAYTDYIFAVVVEELGLIVALIVLALLFYMILRMFIVGIKAKDPFNAMMCIGIGSLFLFQTFVNLGGVTGIIPLTGITFPFLSQGGSSLLMLSIGVAFVLNISAEEKRHQYGIK